MKGLAIPPRKSARDSVWAKGFLTTELLVPNQILGPVELFES